MAEERIRTGGKLTQKTFKNLARELALDLEAIFIVRKEALLQIVQEADAQGWTIDQLMEAIERIQ